MSYESFFNTFVAEISEVGLSSHFSSAWLSNLHASLPTSGEVLNAPEFAFFVMAMQSNANLLNNELLPEVVD
jgi:hypothetical protein